jgi:hypothetical protein
MEENYPEEYLTCLELSQRIKMSPGSIRNLVWKKELRENVHYVKPTPRKVLFLWGEIRKWLHRGGSIQPLSGNGHAKSLINI